MLDKELKSLFEEILDHQIANLGTDSEFYKCYTYNNNDLPSWVGKVKQALTQLEKSSKVQKVLPITITYDTACHSFNIDVLKSDLADMPEWTKEKLAQSLILLAAKLI